MAVQFENWGESFWRSYNMAADAKSRRVEYAKWVQDKLDREQATKIVSEVMKPAETINAKVSELQRASTEVGNAYRQSQSALDEARANGSMDDSKWQAESSRLKEQHDAQMGPISNQIANETSNLGMYYADTAMKLTMQGVSNPYIQKAVENLYSLSNNFGATLFSVQSAREEIVGQTTREMAKQYEMQGTEVLKGEVRSSLEEQRQGNRLEIEGRRDARAAARGGAGGAAGGGLKPREVIKLRADAYKWADKQIENAEDPTSMDRDSLAQKYLQDVGVVEPPPEGAPKEAAQQPNPSEAIDQKLSVIQDALDKTLEELSITRSLAGLDKASAEEAKRRNPQFSYDEGKIKSLQETRDRYQSILGKYRQTQAASSEATRQSDLATYLSQVDELAAELEKGAP